VFSSFGLSVFSFRLEYEIFRLVIVSLVSSNSKDSLTSLGVSLPQSLIEKVLLPSLEKSSHPTSLSLSKALDRSSPTFDGRKQGGMKESQFRTDESLSESKRQNNDQG
jgi:hypothetical protein